MKTDAQLQQDVISELKWDMSVNATDIGVYVKDGIVTLTGHVDSYGEKWGAESAAQHVSGVKAIAVEIDVKLSGLSKRSDADIARSAENVLQWMTFSPTNPVKIMVEDGWVTLTGEVEHNYQRQAAVAELRHLMGVTGVSDQIHLITPASLSKVKSEIEASLNRRNEADIKNILVDVNGGDVTLSGTVNSWYTRELVKNSAWGTHGVKKVIDNITITY